MRAPWAVLCDFDGTLTTEDIGDQVSIRFAGYDAWRKAEDEYAAGRFPFSELLVRIFAPITASQQEIAAFARERAVIRDGFERLATACRDAARPLVVVSAGLDCYIEPVLERLPADLRGHLVLRANRGEPSPAGLRVSFPGFGDGGCPRCGSCKRGAVEALRREGHKVVVCGDGAADRCAAEAADFTFALGKLARFCAEQGLPHATFESFHEVVEKFPL